MREKGAQIDTEKEFQRQRRGSVEGGGKKYRHGQVKGIYKNKEKAPARGAW
jgi:hypothetical protein